jgi:hypothetical protein
MILDRELFKAWYSSFVPCAGTSDVYSAWLAGRESLQPQARELQLAAHDPFTPYVVKTPELTRYYYMTPENADMPIPPDVTTLDVRNCPQFTTAPDGVTTLRVWNCPQFTTAPDGVTTLRVWNCPLFKPKGEIK